MIRRVRPNESWLWDGLVASFVLTLLALTLVSRSLLLAQLDRAALVRDAQSLLDRAFQQDLDVTHEFEDYHEDGDARFLQRALEDEADRTKAMAQLRAELGAHPSPEIGGALRRLFSEEAAVQRIQRLVPGAAPSRALLGLMEHRRADMLVLDSALRTTQTALDRQTRAAIVWVGALAVPIGVFGVALIIVTRRQRTTIRRQREELQTMRRLSELYAIADLVDVLLWSAAPDGTITYLSRRWVDYTGRPVSEMVRIGWFDEIHPDDRAETVRRWTAAIGLGRPYQVEHRIRGADGTFRWFRTLGVPLRDADERIISWFGSSSDIDHIRRRVDEFALPGPRARGNGDGVGPAATIPSFDEMLFDVSRAADADEWCDVFPLPDGRVFVSLGLTADRRANAPLPDLDDTRRAIASLGYEERDPGAVLDRFNALALVRRTGCVAVMCGYVDRATYAFDFATAGHEGPYLSDGDGVPALQSGGTPIGMYAGASFPSQRVVFAGGLLVVFNRLARDRQPGQEAPFMDALRSAKANGSRATAIGERVRSLREDDEDPIVLTMWGAPTTLGVTR